MSNLGIKVVNAGTSILSTDIRDQIMNSQYSMFKYHYDGTISITINSGATDVYGTIAHNLGYVPAFISYYSQGGTQRIVPSLPYGIGVDNYTDAYANTANIVVGFHSSMPFNQASIGASDYWNTYDGNENHFSVGRISNSPFEGALRFTNVGIIGADSLDSAKLYIYTTAGTSSSGTMKFKTYGIDEDNTSSFNNPMARDKTTAYSSTSRTVPTNLGDTVEVDVKDAVLEIADRGGWSSGNAMGFIINEDSGDPDAWFRSDSDTYMLVTKTGTLSIPFRVIIFKDKIV